MEHYVAKQHVLEERSVKREERRGRREEGERRERGGKEARGWEEGVITGAHDIICLSPGQECIPWSQSILHGSHCSWHMELPDPQCIRHPSCECVSLIPTPPECDLGMRLR